VEQEPALIEEKTSSPIKAMKDDQERTAEKDLIEGAAWPEDGLRIAGIKMGAGTAVVSNDAIVSGNNVAGPSVPMRHNLGFHVWQTTKRYFFKH
jgi:hypothetical protein